MEEMGTKLKLLEEERAKHEEELTQISAARIDLDAPSPEEQAQMQAQQKQEMVGHLDNAFQQLRDAMLAQDWETGASQHAAQYEQWKQNRLSAGAPISPPGQWFAAEIMMKQLGQTLMHGRPADVLAASSCPAEPMQQTQAGSPATVLRFPPHLAASQRAGRLSQRSPSAAQSREASRAEQRRQDLMATHAEMSAAQRQWEDL